MSQAELSEFDLAQPAANGLRRGFTTGTCACAAVKAALVFRQSGQVSTSVFVTLPGQQYFLEVPVKSVTLLPDASVQAEVVKNSGDDPDCTNGATIIATVRSNRGAPCRILAGPGVGTVTEPGLGIPVGEPAINAGPRSMILQALEEITLSTDGFDLLIGCRDGERLAVRTFNSRLGIRGGISILGSTGIVEPRSTRAYCAALSSYIAVALGDSPSEIALAPGNSGILFARRNLHLPEKRIVHMANFIGVALSETQQRLVQSDQCLDTLYVLGHPAKLGKILDGFWDTHSCRSAGAAGVVARVAAACGYPAALTHEIMSQSTVEAVLKIVPAGAEGARLWNEIAAQVGRLIAARVPRAHVVAVRLLALDGTFLGGNE